MTTCIIYAFAVAVGHGQLFIKNFKHMPSAVHPYGTAAVTSGTPATLLFFMSPVSFRVSLSCVVYYIAVSWYSVSSGQDYE